jgi:hypothetical protein
MSLPTQMDISIRIDDEVRRLHFANEFVYSGKLADQILLEYPQSAITREQITQIVEVSAVCLGAVLVIEKREDRVLIDNR